MANTELKKALKELSLAATALGGIIPGVGGTVARIIGTSLGVAATFADLGKDPEVEIKRILSSEKAVKDIHDHWEDMIEKKFGKPSEPPAEDPYDE